MSTNLEIEFKNLLSKTEYEQLLHFFKLDLKEIKSQKNVYFDTTDRALQKIHSALRIRIKDNHYELTLKTKDPKDFGALETNQNITKTDYLNLTQHQILVTGVVADKLAELTINLSNLEQLASLTTYRIEFPYEDGVLFLDKSLYGDTIDYEVEYESSDYEIGLKTFKAFLTQHQIPARHAAPKIRRAQNLS